MRRVLYILFFLALFLGWLLWVSPQALASAMKGLNLPVLVLAMSLHFPIAWLQGERLFPLLALERQKRDDCLMLYFVCFPLGFFLSAAALPIQTLLFRNRLGVAPARLLLAFTFVHLTDLLLASLVLLAFPVPVSGLAGGARAFARTLIGLAAALVAGVVAILLFFPPLAQALRRRVAPIPGRIAQGVIRFADDALQVSLTYATSRRLQARVLLVSVAVYALDIVLTYVSFRFALGLAFPALNVAQGIASTRFLSFFPNPPLDIGQHEVGVTLVYTGLFGLAADRIGAVAFTAHLITIPIFLMIGAIGAFRLRLSPRDLLLRRKDGNL